MIIYLLLFAFVLLFCFCLFKSSEGFIIFGELGPFDRPLDRCIDECQRQDPGTFLGTTGGSLFCEMACYDKVRSDLLPTKSPLSKRDSSERDRAKVTLPREKKEVVFSVEKAYDLCGDGQTQSSLECRSKIACQNEIASRCQKECLHVFSLDGAFFEGINTHANDPKYKECLDSCSLVYLPDCQNTSWTWKSM